MANVSNSEGRGLAGACLLASQPDTSEAPLCWFMVPTEAKVKHSRKQRASLDENVSYVSLNDS